MPQLDHAAEPVAVVHEGLGQRVATLLLQPGGPMRRTGRAVAPDLRHTAL